MVKDQEEEGRRLELRKKREGSQEGGDGCGREERAWRRTGCFRM
jgi:hypothetical protein